MSFRLDAEYLARLSLHDASHSNIQLSQTSHRLNPIRQWNIASGPKVLELGCAQGDTTTVLAAVIGEEGKVVAIDPAEMESGEWGQSLEPSDLLELIDRPLCHTAGPPYTLGQAQDHFSRGSLGSRNRWIRQNPLDYLSSIDLVFDAAVLAHTLW